uniref:Uncharacterized protein n=1 Tax=Strongyloides venezuelensis TaxID=75913 RepID=A0A0K0F357_STRVS
MYRNSFIKISEKNNKLDSQDFIIGELKNSLNNEKEKTKLLDEEINVLEESIFNNNCSVPPLPSAPPPEEFEESISNNNCSTLPLPSAPSLKELEENITLNQIDIRKSKMNTIDHPLKFTLNLSINGCQEKNVNLLMNNDKNKIVQNFMNVNIKNEESCKKIIIDTCEEKKCFLFYIFDNNNELSKGYGRCGSLSTIVFLELKALLYALEKINFDEFNDNEELHIFSSHNKLCKITNPDCIDVYKNNDGLFQKIKMYLRRFKKINILSTDSLDQQSAVTLFMGKRLLEEAGKMKAGYFNLI